MIINARTEAGTDGNTEYDSGNVSIPVAYRSNQTLSSTYYNMDGYSRAIECTLTLTSSGLEV